MAYKSPAKATAQSIDRYIPKLSPPTHTQHAVDNTDTSNQHATHQHVSDSTRGRYGVLKASRHGGERADHRLTLGERTLEARVDTALRAAAIETSC